MKWLRPSGREIETTDSKDVVEYCTSLGWKPVKEKRTRRTKQEMEEAKKPEE